MLQSKYTINNSNLKDVTITFNDGVCQLYVANERTLTSLKGKFYYKNESVGINHYWEAYNNNIGIDMSISVPYNNLTIDSQDIVKIGTVYYRIVRIQYHDNKKPCYWTLSLSKQPFAYTEDIDD